MISKETIKEYGNRQVFGDCIPNIFTSLDFYANLHQQLYIKYISRIINQYFNTWFSILSIYKFCPI